MLFWLHVPQLERVFNCLATLSKSKYPLFAFWNLNCPKKESFSSCRNDQISHSSNRGQFDHKMIVRFFGLTFPEVAAHKKCKGELPWKCHGLSLFISFTKFWTKVHQIEDAESLKFGRFRSIFSESRCKGQNKKKTCCLKESSSRL